MEIAPLASSGTQGATGALPQGDNRCPVGLRAFALAQCPSAAVDGADGGAPDPGDLWDVRGGDHQLSGGHARRRRLRRGRSCAGSPCQRCLAGRRPRNRGGAAGLAGSDQSQLQRRDVHGRFGALGSRNGSRGPDRIRTRSGAGGHDRRPHRTGGVASGVAGPRPFVCDRGRGSDARSDGGVPARVVWGVHATSRYGGDLAHRGQHWPSRCADARQSPPRRGTSG